MTYGYNLYTYSTLYVTTAEDYSYVPSHGRSRHMRWLLHVHQGHRTISRRRTGSVRLCAETARKPHDVRAISTPECPYDKSHDTRAQC